MPTDLCQTLWSGSPFARAGRAGPVLALTLLSACATTGDPTQGGLFGWSETKAQQRQAELARQDESAQQGSANARRQVEALQKQHDGLATESERQQKALDRLLAENADLDARLRSLMQQRSLSAADMARLQKIVADNDQLRRKAPTPGAGRKAPTTAAAEVFGDQNGRLLREIAILMQR